MYDRYTRSGNPMKAMKVSALNRYVKLMLDTDGVLSNLWATGEISSLSLNSGNYYFVLKDETASVRAVCFKTAAARLRFTPKEGMEVVVFGRVSLYERDGQFQIIVEDILPQREGSQNKFLNALEKKLREEGLFDESKKRPLVRLPKSIAVVTSAGSAALADILKVVCRRCPFTKIVVFPVYVQGIKSEPSIIGALGEINRAGGFDTVIIARGGGSREDLFTFNSEAVVRAASALSAPFISAIGHETDISLLDLAADVRASSPSSAAELAVPDMREMLLRLGVIQKEVTHRIKDRLNDKKGAAERLTLLLTDEISGKLRRNRDRAGESEAQTNGLMGGLLGTSGERLRQTAAALQNLSPLNVLGRGYAYVEKDGGQIGSVDLIAEKDSVTVRFKDGHAVCTVGSVEKAGANEQLEF